MSYSSSLLCKSARTLVHSVLLECTNAVLGGDRNESSDAISNGQSQCNLEWHEESVLKCRQQWPNMRSVSFALFKFYFLKLSPGNIDQIKVKSVLHNLLSNNGFKSYEKVTKLRG